MNHGVVQKWLRDVVLPYQDADRVFLDVDRTLVAVSSLSPKTEVYTYDDGRTVLLLLLSGTIPIQYRKSTYNIPLDMWVPRQYPREPPITYVRPTNDMLIRKSNNVDPSGRVQVEYLQRWGRKWESCNLLELIHSCQGVFGQEPPVYAKPKQVASPAASSSSSRGVEDLRDRRPPPPPQGHRPDQDGPPQRPAKPGSSYSGYDGKQQSLQPLKPPNPYAQQHSPHQMHLDSTGGWSISPRPSPGSPSFVRDVSPNGHGWEQRSAGRQASWHQIPDTANPSWTRQSLQQPQRSASLQVNAIPGKSPPLIQPPLPPLQRAAFEVTPAQPAANIPAPPRPPNPELLQMHAALHQKIQARLQHLRSTVGESQHQLRLLIGDLDRGEPAIIDEMARLEAVRDVCKATGDGLEEAVSAGKRRVQDLRDRSEPDVDGMICATSIVGNQLIDLVASDSAIEDTLFYLGQALHSEAIEVERYLKQTRFLAREQFMRRALAQKITTGMGW